MSSVEHMVQCMAENKEKSLYWKGEHLKYGDDFSFAMFSYYLDSYSWWLVERYTKRTYAEWERNLINAPNVDDYFTDPDLYDLIRPALIKNGHKEKKENK